MKKIIKIKKALKTLAKILPHLILYVFGLAVLTGSIYVIVQLFSKYGEAKEIGDEAQILIGLSATLLSSMICITGMATFIFNYINKRKEFSISSIGRTNNLVRQLNTDVFIDLSIVQRIISALYATIGWTNIFKPVLSKQDDAINDLNRFLDDKKIDYKSQLLLEIATILFVENNNVNPDMHSFCNTIIKGGISVAKQYLNTIGAVELFYIFKRKRIAVLNYFENLAICYINKTVQRQIVDEQFKIVFDKSIPLFYYEICRLETVDCYPNLNKMLKIIQND